MSKCNDCENNYLYQTYGSLLSLYNNDNKKAGEALNSLALSVRDPRPIIELLNDVTNGNCENCKKYKDLYKIYINDKQL